ncbi:MAG: hypothetical protein WD847_15345 [Pirellulales bacterium]
MTSVCLPFRTLLVGATVSALSLIALSGCSHFDLRKRIPWGEGEDGQLRRPMKVVSMWTETVMTTAGIPPMRGFGGRLMFYPSDDSKPCKVKGSLVVYAFDETHRDPTNLVPDRKYVFTEEQFARHYSKSSLGHSYSVWVPWDEAGGEQREISLIVRFMPAQGGVIVGDETKHLLPGKKPVDSYLEPPVTPGLTRRAPVGNDVQPVNHEREIHDHEPENFAPTNQQRMNTTTISIPAGYGRRTPTALLRPRSNDSIVPGAATGSNSGQTPLGPAARSAPNQPAAIQPDSKQPAAKSGPASTRFGPHRSRALGGSIAPLDRDRGPWRPDPAARPGDPLWSQPRSTTAPSE